MFGYVFIATNSENGKKYIGKRYAVGFDRKYFGDDPKVMNDIEKYGVSAFSCKMLMPYESAKAVEWGYNHFVEEYNALSDPAFYNCTAKVKSEPKVKTEVVEEKPKRTTSRKRKSE